MAEQLSQQTKKNVLDLAFEKNLQFYTTAIIFMMTFAVGVFIALVTKQVSVYDTNQMSVLIIVSIGFYILTGLLLLNFKKHIKRIPEEIKKIDCKTL
jgi:NADH:ubiquinone oxidoreductase subunit B-like Fe-S oxidoreductase